MYIYTHLLTRGMTAMPQYRESIKEYSAEIAALAQSTLQCLGAHLISKTLGIDVVAQGIVVGSAVVAGIFPHQLSFRWAGLPLLIIGLRSTNVKSGYIPIGIAAAAAVVAGSDGLTGSQSKLGGRLVDPLVERVRRLSPNAFPVNYFTHPIALIAGATGFAVARYAYGNVTEAALFVLTAVSATYIPVAVHDGMLSFRLS